MEILLNDLRYALRVTRKSPVFTAIVVLTLALGIGANTAIFSLMNAVLLKTLPVKDPGSLVVVGDPTFVHRRASNYPPRVDIYSYRLFCDLRDNNSVFSGMLVTGEVQRVRVERAGNTQGSAITDQAMGVMVSGNYFSVLGVNPFLGRTLAPTDDDVAGAHPVAVVSYGFWKDKLGSDSKIVGQTVLLNDYPFTIVGVAPAGFFGDAVGDQQDIWFPVTMQAQVVHGRELLKGYDNSWFHIMARLKPGVNREQARENLNAIYQQLVNGPVGSASQFATREALQEQRIQVVEGGTGFCALRGKYQDPLWLLMGIVGLVLLVACVNVANLLLARALGRRREIAMRLALGAAPRRIVRQLLTESLLLACVGGTVGLLVAQWGVRILLQMSVGPATEVHLDSHVLGFTAVVCLATGILFGIVPATRAVDVSLISVLKDRSNGESGDGNSSRINWGKILVAGQVALSVCVLFTAGLLVRSMKNLRTINLGLNTENLLIIRMDQRTAGYKTPQQRTSVGNQLAAKLSALPGVRAISFSQDGLYFGDQAADTIRVDGFIPRTSTDLNALTDRIGPNYFSLLGVPLLRGREITAQDTETSGKVTVVNEAFAKFYFGDIDPIGRTVWITDADKPLPYRVDGVVANAHDQALRGAVQPRFYIPMSQSDDAEGVLHFLIRTDRNPDTIAASARNIVKEFDSKIPIIAVSSLSNQIDESIRGEITIAQLSSFFGVLALLLACMGLYGLMSYAVARKKKAIGVRMALGAQPSDVLRLVLGEAMSLVGIGILVGIPVALLCSRWIASLLYGLKVSDPVSLLVVVLTLGVVATMASLIPAWRATRVDPLIALREE
jgi:predicted permease